jgi:sugar phosphate isomerase/epimerase
MEELGAGTLDLPAIIAKGMDYNVKYFAVEQDGNFVPFGWPGASAQNPNGGTGGDSMLSSVTSMQYLQTLFGTTAHVRSLGVQRAQLPAPAIKDTELSLDLAGMESFLADYAGSVTGIRGILKDIKGIGYGSVQVSDKLHGLTIEQWASLLKETGLMVSGYQISAVPASADIDGVIDAAKLLGTNRVIYSDKIAFGAANAQTYANSAAVVSQLPRVKRALNSGGVTFIYRVTNKDFAQKQNSDGYAPNNTNATYSKRSAIDDVYDAGIPLDIDTFWTARSSRTVRDEVDKYAGDIAQISLQDLGITWAVSFVSEELYEGHLNLDSIISAANAAGVKSYVVTQEGAWFGNDPIASAKRSFDMLKSKGILKITPVTPPVKPPVDPPSNSPVNPPAEEPPAEPAVNPPADTPVNPPAQPAAKISFVNVVVNKVADQTYTGDAITPALAITVDGKALVAADYVAAYTNNVNVGTAMVTITGIGAYDGTATATFNIVAPKVANVTGVKAKAAKKSIGLTWNRVPSATSYKIYYTTDKNFKKSIKSVTIKSNRTVKYTIKKLKTGKTYYVKVRGVNNIGSKTFYGAYTKAYKAKVK